VHGDKKLLNKAYTDKFRDNVERRIRSRGVDLILDDYIDSLTASTTRKGVPLDADLIVPARGPKPNTEWIGSSLGEDVVTERGLVRIKPTMQVAGYPGIFALGDIIDFPEQKQLGKYPAHSAVVAANIKSFLNGKQLGKEYKGQGEMIVVTMGKVWLFDLSHFVIVN
jgi:apoptosis-inducing factor 2